jgi:hypothetical protein
MAQKKIEIIIDIENNDVQIASEKTLTLTQQIKLLRVELLKTKEGTKEFDILKNKLNETKDNFDRVNVKSRELFGTLSLLPGPIGEIAGKVNGAISLLKTFSGFSFKDIQSQFKALGEDVKNIFAAIGSFGETANQTAEAEQNLATATGEVGDSAETSATQVSSASQSIADSVKKQEEATKAQATASAEASSKQRIALETRVKQLGDLIAAEKAYQTELQSQIATIDQAISLGDLEGETLKEQIEIRGELNNQLEKSGTALTGYKEQINASKDELNALTQQEKDNAEKTKKSAETQAANSNANKQSALSAKLNAAATQASAVAATAASRAFTILKGVLISIGIGAIIVAVGEFLNIARSWLDSTEKQEAAQKALNDELANTNQLLELEEATVKRANALRISELKASGANEVTIRQEVFKQREADLKRALANEAEAIRQYNAALGKADSETLKALFDNELKRTEQRRDAENQLRIIRNEGIAAERKETNDFNNKKKEKAAKDAADRLAKQKADLDAQIELEIRKGNTDKTVLENLQKQRLDLEKKSGADLLLAQDNNRKQLTDALEADAKVVRDKKVAQLDALIQLEKDKGKEGLETSKVELQKLYDERLQLELQSQEFSEEEKKALRAKYAKELEDELKADNEKQLEIRQQRLVKEIDDNRGNFDKQIELYQQFQQEVKKSETITAGEKLRILKETNDEIENLNQERFDNELNKIQLAFDNQKLSVDDYYTQLFAAYDKEEQRYKDLRASGQITDAEYTAFLKANNETRRQLDKEELDAKMANFQAVSQLFAAGASLVGEQTKAGKAFAIASATIDTYVAANQVIKDPTVPTFLKIITAAGIIVKGLANVKKIIDVKLPTPGGDAGSADTATKPMGTINVNAQRRAQGGMVTGPGSETSDSIPAMLSNGEYVVNARSTRLFQPILSAINNYGLNTPQFAAGGLVMGAQTSQPQSSMSLNDAIQETIRREPIRTYVTSQDVTNQQQFDRIIKSRSLI